MTEQWDGRPQNPERDGWHWVTGADEQPPIAVFWYQLTQHWVLGSIGIPPGSLSGATYLGPCLTPAEIERLRSDLLKAEMKAEIAGLENIIRAVAKGRREGIEAAVKWHEAEAAWWSQGADAVTRQPDLSEQEAAARAIEFRENAAEHQSHAEAIRALLEDGR